MWEFLNKSSLNSYIDLPWWFSGKESSYQCRRCRFDSWVGKIHLEKEMATHLAFLPGKSHGQRSLVGYSPWAFKSQIGLNTETTSPVLVFCLLLEQIIINFVLHAYHLTVMLQKSDTDLRELKSRHLELLGENLFPCLFHLLETTHIPGFMALFVFLQR